MCKMAKMQPDVMFCGGGGRFILNVRLVFVFSFMYWKYSKNMNVDHFLIFYIFHLHNF